MADPVDQALRACVLDFLKRSSDARYRYAAFHQAVLSDLPTATTDITALSPDIQRSYYRWKASAIRARNRQHPMKRMTLGVAGEPVDQIQASYHLTGCKLTSSLVGALCDVEGHGAMATVFNSASCRGRGGLPDMKEIKSTPSADLLQRYRTAAAAAASQGQSTALLVSMADVGILRAAEMGDSKVEGHSTFSHSFTLLVTPQGLSVFQSYGPEGYSMDEWLQQHCPEPMNAEATERFMTDFNDITRAKRWTADVNAAYKRCFGVDMLALCERHNKPLWPKQIEAYVRVMVIPDVTVEKIDRARTVITYPDVPFCYRCAKPQQAEGPRLQSCAKCKKATYCSKGCQKVDWQEHKVHSCELYQGKMYNMITTTMRDPSWIV